MDRTVINRLPGRSDPRARAVYAKAQSMLDAGARCSDCADVHTQRRAVAFGVQKCPPSYPDADYFVTFFCQYHADIFLMKKETDGLYINGRRVVN
jgi:hypothetical protein